MTKILPTRRDLPWLLLLLAIMASMLPFPLTDDTGHWQSMAYDLIHYGRWPYIGSWDQTFPGAILPHFFAQILFGPSDFGFRFFDLCVQMIAVWMLYRFWRMWLDERLALLTVLIYAFFYVRSAPFLGGMRDVYASLLVIGAAFPFLREREIRLRQLVVSGLLYGIAITMRPTYAVYPLLLVLFTPIHREFKKASAFILICIVPLALTYVIYALKPGGLQEYWNSTVRFNLDTYGIISRPFRLFLKGMISPMMLGIPAVIGAVMLWRKGRFNRVQILYIAAILASLAVVLMQRKYYAYHFTMYYILITPLAAYAIDRALAFIPKQAQLVSFILLFWILALPYENLIKHFRARPAGESLIGGVTASFETATWPDTSDAPMVEYIESHTSSSDRVEVCSLDPRERLRLHREPVGPYASLHAIGFRKNIAVLTSFTDYQKVWRRAYLDSLAAVRPKYIVLCRASGAEYLLDPYKTILTTIPGFDSLLQTSYGLDTTIGKDEIYRRRDP